MTPVRRGNLDALTGFRFIAALLVFVSHFSIPGLTGTALRVTLSGHSGVTLFFVLSGFVIGYNYIERFEAGMGARQLGEYFVARVARFYPLYLCFILFGALAQDFPSLPWGHILALQAWNPDVQVAFGVNSAAWSVGVEVFLYLAFPLLVPLLAMSGALTSLRRLLWAAALVSLAMFCIALVFALTGRGDLPADDPTSAHRWLYRTPLTRLGDFLLGMFGAVYFIRFARTDPATVRRWGFVTYLCVVVVVLLLTSMEMFASSFSWDVAYALPAILLIIGLAISPGTLIGRALSSPALILLGEASYAFYLVHLPAAPLRYGTAGGLGHQLGLYFVFLVMVIALSIGLHIVIEKPARRWIRGLGAVRTGSEPGARRAT